LGFIPLLLSFAPWLSFKLILLLPLFEPLTMVKIGIIVATVICLYQCMTGLHKGAIMWGSIIFFCTSTVMVVFLTNMWYLKYLGVLASATLCGLTWISILVRNPFTLAYAKAKVDPVYWNAPGFIRKNYKITAAWGIAFTFNVITAVVKLYNPHIPGYVFEIADDAAMLLAIFYTMHYSHPPTPASGD
jgi:hypothetical protein